LQCASCPTRMLRSVLADAEKPGGWRSRSKGLRRPPRQPSTACRGGPSPPSLVPISTCVQLRAALYWAVVGKNLDSVWEGCVRISVCSFDEDCWYTLGCQQSSEVILLPSLPPPSLPHPPLPSPSSAPSLPHSLPPFSPSLARSLPLPCSLLAAGPATSCRAQRTPNLRRGTPSSGESLPALPCKAGHPQVLWDPREPVRRGGLVAVNSHRDYGSGFGRGGGRAEGGGGKPWGKGMRKYEHKLRGVRGCLLRRDWMGRTGEAQAGPEPQMLQRPEPAYRRPLIGKPKRDLRKKVPMILYKATACSEDPSTDFSGLWWVWCIDHLPGLFCLFVFFLLSSPAEAAAHRLCRAPGHGPLGGRCAPVPVRRWVDLVEERGEASRGQRHHQVRGGENEPVTLVAHSALLYQHGQVVCHSR